MPITPVTEETVVLTRPPVALTIAGSDPSGGAGIQADLKTFSALGAYGTSVVTALTAQATTGVTGVHQVPGSFVSQQISTLCSDVRVDAVKIGMLGDAHVAGAVFDALRDELADVDVVLDPVMVSTSGARLLDDDAVDAVRDLCGRVSVITPNLPEAAVLLEGPVAKDLDGAREQARRLHESFGVRVLLKGGHLEDEDRGTDLWVDHDGVSDLPGERLETDSTHGTGCTLSAAIAALRPRYDDWWPAVQEAKAWLTEALRHGEVLEVGAGPGPVHHFHELERWRG